MSLFSLGFALCELRKALMLKGMWRVFKTPKVGVANCVRASPRRYIGVGDPCNVRGAAGISVAAFQFQGLPDASFPLRSSSR